MSKELEALETFNYIMARCKDEDSYIIKFPLGVGVGTTFGEDMEKAYKVIKDALQRLETMDNSNPSEALELLKETKRRYFNFEYVYTQQYIDHWKNLIKTLDVVEQALIKAQEQEKVLEIIDEKGVDVGYLKTCKTVEQYNAYCWGDEDDVNKKLTQEEFDILKRYVEQ